jgi:hypothetical protein
MPSLSGHRCGEKRRTPLAARPVSVVCRRSVQFIDRELLREREESIREIKCFSACPSFAVWYLGARR